MKTTRDRVKELYEDKKLWRPAQPPSIGFIAKKLGKTKGCIHRYVKELENRL